MLAGTTASPHHDDHHDGEAQYVLRLLQGRTSAVRKDAAIPSCRDLCRVYALRGLCDTPAGHEHDQATSFPCSQQPGAGSRGLAY